METKEFKFENELILRALAQAENEMNWFVANDVCQILGIADTSQAMERLDEDEKRKEKIHSDGQLREVWLVNEFGLYQLILTSDKQEVKKFKRWVTHEVLPSIRVSGKYTQKEIRDRDEVIKKTLDRNKTLGKEIGNLLQSKKNKEKEIRDNDELIKKLLTTDFRQTVLDFPNTEQL